MGNSAADLCAAEHSEAIPDGCPHRNRLAAELFTVYFNCPDWDTPTCSVHATLEAAYAAIVHGCNSTFDCNCRSIELAMKRCREEGATVWLFQGNLGEGMGSLYLP